MHIEDIFEDLEAQFDAEFNKSKRDSFTENVRAIIVRTIQQNNKDLIAPIMGNEFIAGLDSISPIWHIYPMRALCSITMHSEIDESLPVLKNIGVDLAAFLESLPVPSSIKWRVSGIDDFLHTGQLHSISRNLLFIYPPGAAKPIAVPISALEQLSIESVDNLNGEI